MRINQHEGVIEAIRAKMTLVDISQAELARRSGVKQGTISRIISYKRRPKSTTLSRLLDALNLRIEGF